MKNKLFMILATIIAVVMLPKTNLAQAPNLGTAADFVLFTTNGAVTNVGITHLTGHVGSNVGGSTGFGNVDGVMHDQDPASAQATLDLNAAYLQLDAAVATNSPGVLLGSGMTLVPGVHNIPAAATMNGDLNLDAQNIPGAIFIIQIEGAFGVGANAKVILLNGALACNVYWKVDGAVSIAPGVVMKGTIVVFNDFIAMSAGDSLEGRALSINGAVGVTGIVARTPLGCLAPVLTGPANPDLLSTECFVLFSAIGPVTNVGITTVTGDIGTNSGSTLGFNPLFVTGTIHPVPDAVTAQCATDFTTVYNNLNGLPYDIELLYPAQFGNDLVLTPHTYLMNSAVTFTDSLYLNAQGNPDGVFVIQVNGAFGTSTYSNVILMNGAQAKNVYWVINGAISINDYSIFNGSVISQGAIDLLTGVTLYGRALTGVGAISTFAMDAIMPTSCSPTTITEPMDTTACDGSSATFTVYADGVGLTYQWRLGNVNLVNGGNISGATTATLTINPATAADVANDYNVIISGSFMPADTSVFVSLFIELAPVITLEPIDQTICEGDSVTFEVMATGTGLTYQWRNGIVNMIDNAFVSGSTTSQLTIDPAFIGDASTNYNVIVTNDCLLTDTSNFVSLIISPSPVAVPTSNSPVCEGSPINLFAQTVVGGTYIWTGPSSFNSTVQNPVITLSTLLNEGYYVLTVSDGTCNSISDSVFVQVTNCPADVSVTKTVSDMEPMMGETIVFTITATNNGPSTATGVSVDDILESGYTYVSSTTTQGAYVSGTWTIGTMNNGASETMTITVIVNSTGIYTNTATITSTSTDNDLLNNTSTIEPIPFDFFIPEGFSPNGDGVNDLFVIRGISHYPLNNIVIFNRWGNKVFEASPYQSTWDGTSSTGVHIGGEDLPVGTYFYVLELGDGSDFYKGTIYLNN